MEHSPALPSTIVLWCVKGFPVMLDDQGGKPKSSRAPAYDCCDSRPDPFDRVLPLLSPNCVPENPPPRVRAGVVQPDRQRQPAGILLGAQGGRGVRRTPGLPQGPHDAQV